jgi:hypothetical protein
MKIAWDTSMYGFGQGLDDEPEQMPPPLAQYGTEHGTEHGAVSLNSQD